MRLLAYFHPAQDPFVLRARLMASGWRQVAMRDGSLWRSDSRPEQGWPSVHAPLFPGIAQAYQTAGAQVVDEIPGTSIALPAPPRLVDLPASAVWAIVNPGRFLLDQLAAVPIPDGAQIIGVNEAARRVACTWQLCNDGFTDPKFQGVLGSPGRITRARFAATIPTGDWFDLGRIGIVEGDFSTTCALRCAAHGKAATVYLYGHDLQPGNGLDGMTGHWDASQCSNACGEVAGEIARMRAAGVRVVHVRMVDGKAEQDDGSSRVVTLTPAPRPKSRKGR